MQSSYFLLAYLLTEGSSGGVVALCPGNGCALGRTTSTKWDVNCHHKPIKNRLPFLTMFYCVTNLPAQAFVLTNEMLIECRYVAPEYAMTGHLLVKSDVYSYGVVLLELLSGRKPVDMSQPLGQENLVTWARPLLTNSNGLELVVDPALGNKFPFDSFARVAAIASMCVQPEVSHRPFMGEVVQALKLVYADSDACDSEHHSGRHHQRGTSPTSDLVETQQSHFLTDESFISIDYDSGPLDDLEIEQHKPMSASAILLGSGRLFQQFSSSFRRHSSSGPPKILSLPRAPWYSFRNPNSTGTRSEQGAAKYANSQSSFYGL